jgi:lauroyl/myristoyl acyltransferase
LVLGLSSPCAFLDDIGKKFFEVLSCDEIDAYVPLIHPWQRLRRWVRVTGEERLLPLVTSKQGVILLTFHIGGGFLLFPYLRSRGVAAHFLSIPLQRVHELNGRLQYLSGKFRLWSLEQAIGKEVIFVGGSKEKIRRILRDGGIVVALLDVTPEFLGLKEWAEVLFFDRPARFPTGLLSAAAQTHAAIVPFFGRIGDDMLRYLSFEEPLSVANENDSLRSLVALLEMYIRRHPHEWHHWPAVQAFSALAEGAPRKPC